MEIKFRAKTEEIVNAPEGHDWSKWVELRLVDADGNVLAYTRIPKEFAEPDKDGFYSGTVDLTDEEFEAAGGLDAKNIPVRLAGRKPVFVPRESVVV